MYLLLFMIFLFCHMYGNKILSKSKIALGKSIKNFDVIDSGHRWWWHWQHPTGVSSCRWYCTWWTCIIRLETCTTFRYLVKWNNRCNLKFLVYQKIRPEVGEKLLKQGITSIDQLGKKDKPKKIEKVSVVKNVQKVVLPKKKPIVFHPIPIYHYVPYFRHTFSHHTTQRHRHYFY